VAESFGMRRLVCCEIGTDVRNFQTSLEAGSDGMNWNGIFRHDDG
jgi:hypothetical protein